MHDFSAACSAVPKEPPNGGASAPEENPPPFAPFMRQVLTLGKTKSQLALWNPLDITSS
jgi:hypothetical protein